MLHLIDNHLLPPHHPPRSLSLSSSSSSTVNIPTSGTSHCLLLHPPFFIYLLPPCLLFHISVHLLFSSHLTLSTSHDLSVPVFFSSSVYFLPHYQFLAISSIGYFSLDSILILQPLQAPEVT